MTTPLAAMKAVITTALTNDSGISSYCTTNFSKALTVLVGIDANKPPIAADTCPYVAVTLGKRARESNGDYVGHEVTITTVIADDGITTTGTVTAYDGAETLEGLHDLVEKCSTKALYSHGYPANQVPDVPDQTPGEIFPFFSASSTYLVRVTNPL